MPWLATVGLLMWILRDVSFAAVLFIFPLIYFMAIRLGQRPLTGILQMMTPAFS
ncbi:MAG: hypothetical protein GY796_25825 [Chloroflexi bacterium]|nr:hypothetical protein [Chloroflexota bacterium]